MREAEADLVRRLQAGEDAAYRELVDAYRDRIVTVIARIAGPRADPEDLAQDTFLKAFSAVGRFEGQSALFTWLYRIAVNTARDWHDKERRRPTVSLDDPGRGDGERGLQIADESLSPAARAELAEEAARVRAALERLPEPFRTTLVLREMEGHSYEEVAVILGISLGTVESRIFRARCKLRALLDGRDEE